MWPVYCIHFIIFIMQKIGIVYEPSKCHKSLEFLSSNVKGSMEFNFNMQ